MTSQVDFHPSAMDEVIAARRWYVGIEPSLADAFETELDRAIEKVAAAPHRWSKHLHGTRKLLLHRFPYLVVYRYSDKQVQVVAVQHVRRKPAYWKSRITPH